MNRSRAGLGTALLRHLSRPLGGYTPYSVVPLELLRRTARPGDVLLVEGDSRISAAIKYLTQSTWSHAALVVGDGAGRDLIEADPIEGVRYVPLSRYAHLNLRLCRPVGLDPDDLARVLGHMRASLGHTYDLRNILDLARYLVPQPPVPRRFRRRLIAFGSGDPTRAICSSLIAEAFQSVRYPILPAYAEGEEARAIRHHSLYVPRDFDLSPYFAVVKPTLELGFDYRALGWTGWPERAQEGAG